jgi:hypothetical protein
MTVPNQHTDASPRSTGLLLSSTGNERTSRQHYITPEAGVRTIAKRLVERRISTGSVMRDRKPVGIARRNGDDRSAKSKNRHD